MFITDGFTEIAEHFNPGNLIETLDGGFGIPENNLWLHAVTMANGDHLFWLYVTGYDVGLEYLVSLDLADESGTYDVRHLGADRLAADLQSWYQNCIERSSVDVRETFALDRMQFVLRLANTGSSSLILIYDPTVAGDLDYLGVMKDGNLEAVPSLRNVKYRNEITGEVEPGVAALLRYFDLDPPAARSAHDNGLYPGVFRKTTEGVYASIEFLTSSRCVVTTGIFPYTEFPTSYSRDGDYIVVETDTSDLVFEIIDADTLEGSGYARGTYVRE